jgi:hypothetical protein
MSQNLGTSGYTLASFKAGVRSQSGAMSEQESGLINVQINDLVHSAVLFVRAMMGRLLDPFYATNQTISILNGYKINAMTTTPTVGGTLYRANDVLILNMGSGDATIMVNTVDGGTGAVTSIYATPVNAGTAGYSVATGIGTIGGESTCTVAIASVSGIAGYGFCSLASYSIADPTKISLFHATLKEIPIVSIEQFNAIKTLYSTSDISTTTGIATIMAKSNGLNLALYANSATSFPLSVSMYYPRNPVKVTTDADTLDLPDYLIPITQDVAVMSVFRRLGKAAPTDVNARVTGFINSQVAQLGIKVSPQGL